MNGRHSGSSLLLPLTPLFPERLSALPCVPLFQILQTLVVTPFFISPPRLILPLSRWATRKPRVFSTPPSPEFTTFRCSSHQTCSSLESRSVLLGRSTCFRPVVAAPAMAPSTDPFSPKPFPFLKTRPENSRVFLLGKLIGALKTHHSRC